VGGLLNPPGVVAVRDAELAVGFVAALPVLGTPRRAGAEVVVGPLFTVAAEFAVAGLAEVDAAAGSVAGASVCCTTSKPSASDMFGSAPCQ
jgi:hypothetical protein